MEQVGRGASSTQEEVRAGERGSPQPRGSHSSHGTGCCLLEENLEREHPEDKPRRRKAAWG